MLQLVNQTSWTFCRLELPLWISEIGTAGSCLPWLRQFREGPRQAQSEKRLRQVPIRQHLQLRRRRLPPPAKALVAVLHDSLMWQLVQQVVLCLPTFYSSILNIKQVKENPDVIVPGQWLCGKFENIKRVLTSWYGGCRFLAWWAWAIIDFAA